MPYEFEWLDEARRVVVVRLHSPLAASEIEALHAHLTSAVATVEPLYILADIGNYNLMAAYSEFGEVLKTLSMPAMSDEQMKRSRVAVVGGGPLVGFALSFAEGMLPEGELIQAFKHEDQAYTWLSDAASQAGV